MLEKIREISFLYDFYGELLPEKQRDIFRLYHEDNFSLAEIAAEYGITRQGVHEAVRRSEEKLKKYEDKLGLVKKFTETENALHIIQRNIEALIIEYGRDEQLKTKLIGMKNVLEKLTV